MDKPTTTRSCTRTIQQAPDWIRAIETRNASAATNNYFASLAEIEEDEVMGMSMVENENIEFTNVGDGVGGGFDDTAELKPMKYDDKATNEPDSEALMAEKLTMSMLG